MHNLTIIMSAMQKTYKSVWKAHIALTQTMSLQYFILPVALYASECWAPSKADLALLDALDQWHLRRIMGITWRDHIMNTEVQSHTDQLAVSETIRHRRLAMLGHVSRMPPSADAYRAVYQHPYRRPGRPRQTWLATIRRELQLLDIELDDVPDLAADRALWRGLTLGTTHHSGAYS